MDDRGSDLQLSGHEADLIQYRSVSPMAIVSMILGLLSALALFGPSLWIVPLITLVVATLTLRTISRAESEVSGRGAVIAALALAALFGACGPARYLSRQAWLVGQARQYADDWIQLVRDGRLLEAHQLHLPQHNRVATVEELDIHYEDPDTQQSYTEFVDREPVLSLVASAHGGSVEYTGLINSYGGGLSESFALGYRIRYRSAGADQAMGMTIVLYRRADPHSHDFRWNVETVTTNER